MDLQHVSSFPMAAFLRSLAQQGVSKGAGALATTCQPAKQVKPIRDQSLLLGSVPPLSLQFRNSCLLPSGKGAVPHQIHGPPAPCPCTALPSGMLCKPAREVIRMSNIVRAIRAAQHVDEECSAHENSPSPERALRDGLRWSPPQERGPCIVPHLGANHPPVGPPVGPPLPHRMHRWRRAPPAPKAPADTLGVDGRPSLLPLT